MKVRFEVDPMDFDIYFIGWATIAISLLILGLIFTLLP